MTYKINKNLLEEIALQINSKKYTFKEVWDILDAFVNQGIDFDDGTTYVSRWQDFLNNGEPKTLGECIEEACAISGRASFTDMVSYELTEEFPHDSRNFPDPAMPYESYIRGQIYYGGDPQTNLTSIITKTFINPCKKTK